ncbi:LapA family protein [Streptomyces sp. NPDC047108]|uniref:LapA family protein n=1 Tax=Streptomyces sp. NPDC047108 TaxID=3155025 RepID=UPI0033C62BFF
MSSRTSTSRMSRGRRGGMHGSRWGDVLTPGRVVVGVLLILCLVFIFENTGETKIRLLIPEVIMPLWLALLAVGLIGFICGAFLFFHRRR